MSSLTCYYAYGDSAIQNATEWDLTPCGQSLPGFYDSSSGIQLCCQAGDLCGANSICKWANETNRNEYGSGFYVGGCTDPEFKDPTCRRTCNQYNFNSDIVFVEDGVWACCAKLADGSNTPNCSDPLLGQAYDLGWNASQFPGPLANAYTPASATTLTVSDMPASSTTLTTSDTPISTANKTATSSAVTTSSKGISTGAKAGIGVGVALGVLALLVIGIIFWLRHKRQRNKLQEKATHMERTQMIQNDDNDQSGHFQPRPYELVAGKQNAELDATERARAELQALGRPPAELGT